MRAAGLNLRQPLRAFVFAGWVISAVMLGYLFGGLMVLIWRAYDGRIIDSIAIFGWAMIPVGLVAIPYVVDALLAPVW